MPFTHPPVKARFSKGFVFANLQAANEFEDQRTRFFQENEIRDDYMEVWSVSSQTTDTVSCFIIVPRTDFVFKG